MIIRDDLVCCQFWFPTLKSEIWGWIWTKMPSEGTVQAVFFFTSNYICSWSIKTTRTGIVLRGSKATYRMVNPFCPLA